MSKILCPVDFSSTSLNAIEYAVGICKKTKGNLLLLNVFTEEEFNQVVDSPIIGKSFKEKYTIATKKLTAICEQINEVEFSESVSECTASIVLGDLEEQILNTSVDEKCRLIVMGTTGVGRKAGMFLGSNTSDIIKKSKIPILCVPKASSFDSFKRAVFATDIQEEDKIKIQDVISFATNFESRVSVLHLLHNKNEAEERKSLDFLNELKTFISYKKISFEIKVAEKDFADELLTFIQEKNSDILFIYSPHRSYFNNLFHKSISQQLSVISNTPLYVLK